MSELSFLEACYVFDYNPKTGELRWAINARAARIGDIAGKPGSHPYLRVRYRGVLYRVHRVIWLMAYGRWPDGDVDHINGDKRDNRLENLRAVSRQVNLQNQRKAHQDSKSGYLGVHFNKGKWVARIRPPDGPQIYLGRFSTPEEAGDVYLEAKRRLHEGCVI